MRTVALIMPLILIAAMFRFSRRFRWFRWVVILVGLYALVGFFLLPPLVRAQLPKRLSAALGRSVTIGGVRVNPFALSATLENVNVTERDQHGSFLGWDRLYVNFDPMASLFGEWVIGAVELEGFHGSVLIGADGALNFFDLLADAKGGPGVEPSGRKAPRPVRVGRLQVTRAQVRVRDESRRQPFTTLVGPMTFLVTDFRTSGRADSPYAFEATTEAGERIAWRGTVTTAPFRSSGEFHLDDVSLPKYAPYYSELLGAVVEGGRVSVGGKYEANFSDEARKLVVKGATVSLRDLRIVEPGVTEPLINLPKLDVTGINADALTRRIVVARVALEGGSVAVRREADGKLNWQHVVAPRQTTATANAGSANVEPSPVSAAGQPLGKPVMQVGEIAISGLKVHATDLALAQPAEVTLNALKVDVKNFSLADGVTMPVQVAFDWAPEGAVQFDGTVALKPTLAANLVVGVTKMALTPVSPYLKQQLNARLVAGAWSMQSRVQVSSGEGGPVVNIAGDAAVTNLALAATGDDASLASWTDLTLQKFSVATAPQLKIAIDEVKLAAPIARIVVRPDGTLNLASLHPASASAAAPVKEATAETGKPASPPPQISIGRVTIGDGDFAFTDQSIKPAVRMAVTKFGGAITGLSSEGGAKADVELSASVDGSGPVKVTGQFDPLGRQKSALLTIDLRNVDLAPLSPYAAKFAGYELARGKLQVEVKFQMQDSALNSADVITLDQFTWGAASNSPDATKLPVRLGVALLKDRSGKIVLDVPVEGNLNDPNFRVGRVVWRVIGNVLAKAATSPFALLGSMFGGGEELGWQEFAPGSSALQTSEEKKLVTMVKALTERPGLSVAIAGGYDAAVDQAALQQRKLEEQLRAHVREKLPAAEAASATTEQPAMTAAERAEAVKEMYAQEFSGDAATEGAKPSDVAAAAQPVGKANSQPAVSSAASSGPKSDKDAGLAKSTWNFLTLKSWRERRAEEREQALQRAAAEARQREATQAAGANAPAVVQLTVDEMAARLARSVAITPDDLRFLAEQRARVVRDSFTRAGIAGERVFLESGGEGAAATAAPRVTLSLR